MADNFSLLDDKMQRWVWQQGWEGLREIQQNAIPEVIGADRDVVISAPTAGGKTEAAYLPIISNVLEHPVEEGFAVLNISPLKALINDQWQRLESMTAGTGIDVTPWHGDIAASRKAEAMARPGGILMITPESLESMLINRPHKIEAMMRNLRYVVIDEFHAFVGNERGVQLQSQLARIENMIGRKVPRIAISATFADPSLATDMLRPMRGDYPVAVPARGSGGHDTLILLKEYVASESVDFEKEVTNDIYRNLRGSNNLVFTNSRKEAEALALKLRDLSDEQGVPNEFHVHHGSLSKLEREGVEKSLKRGTLPTTAICTSTLELGIDIGKVKSIAQIETANSVIGLRQRLGRSGRRGQPSILRVYSRDEQRDDYKFNLRTALVQNIAVIELLARSEYERPDLRQLHYSTLVQQLLSMTAQYGSFYPRDAWNLLCRDGAFPNVSPDDFLTLLRHMGSKDILTSTASGQIVIGKSGERVVKGRDFYSAFVTIKDLPVLDKATGREVGCVQYKPYVGEYILLGAQRWLVEAVDENTGQIYVNKAHTTGKMMFEGFGAEIDGIITAKMREVYECDREYAYLDKSLGTNEQLRIARGYYHDMGLDKCSHIDIEGSHLLFTWGGARINRTIALMNAGPDGRHSPYDPFSITDVSPDDVRRILDTDWADGSALAAQLPRYRKAKGKFDFLVPDSLIDKQYASAMLDVDGACRLLAQINT